MSIRQIGTDLSKIDMCLHEGSPEEVSKVKQWTQPPAPPEFRHRWWKPPKARPFLFFHPHYSSHKIYAEGVHDVMGYWAENRILDGVSAFDRRAERSTPNKPPNVIMNSTYANRTERLYQLDDTQQQTLVDFLLSDIEQAETKTTEACNAVEISCDQGTGDNSQALKRKQSDTRLAHPLPMLLEHSNRIRWRYYEAKSDHDIYQDVWERMPPFIETKRILGGRPVAEVDEPWMIDVMLAVNKWFGDTPLWKREKIADGSQQQQQQDRSNRQNDKDQGIMNKSRNRSNCYDYQAAWARIDVSSFPKVEHEDAIIESTATETISDEADHDSIAEHKDARQSDAVLDQLEWKAITLDWV